jgi:cytidine deaminase
MGRARARRQRAAVSPAALMLEAERARRRAYAPYSGFSVGAALLARSGIVFHGCNVENASYGLGVCAERSALFHALSSGQREFVAIAVTGPPGRAAPPCGACRQVLSEFAPRLEVIFRAAGGRLRRRRLDALLPEAFGLGGEARRIARPRRARRKARG